MFVLHSNPLRRHKRVWELTALFLGSFLAASSALAQVPTATPPVPVWTETFSSGTPPTRPLGLTGYTGGGGEVYFADSDWLPGYNACNGWILNSTTAAPPVSGINGDSGCSGATGDGGIIVLNNAGVTGQNRPAWLYLRRMAYQLGIAQGQTPADANNNDALASMTNGGKNQTHSIQFATSSPQTPISVTEGHFYIGSVWVAEVHCSTEGGARGWTDSSEKFSLLVGGATTLLADGYSPCSQGVAPVGSQSLVHDTNDANHVGDLHVSQMLTPGWLAPSNTSVGIQIENTTLNYRGNDVALDTPQLLDATPTLYKSFNPAPTTSSDYTVPRAAGGERVLMTFIIVNTGDYQKKEGWSFTDTLPNGVLVDATPNVQTKTCGTVTVTDPGTGAALVGGETSIAVTGNLLEGVANGACTVSLYVLVPDTVGDYENAPVSNLKDLVGLVNPNTATLHVADLVLSKTAVVSDPDVTGGLTPDILKVGDIITYTFTVTNDSGNDIEGLIIDEIAFTGKGTIDMSDCESKFTAGAPGTGAGGTRLNDGETLTCEGIYTITQLDMDDPSLHEITNTAEVKPTVDTPSPPSSVTIPVDRPALTLVKSASTNQLVAGDTVTFLFRIQNIGNVDLAAVHIDEVHFTGTGLLPPAAIVCPFVDLAIGAAMTCSADYTVTAEDVAAGVITNEADAIGAVMGIAPRTGNLIVLETITSQYSLVRIGSPAAAPIPTLDARMLALLVVVLGGSVAWLARRRVWESS